MKKTYILLCGLIGLAITITKFPQAEISNGLIRANIYLPDSKKGYYQGQRFDWSGNMQSLEFDGHNYFGQWFTEYSPEIHDVIMGPVEAFTPLDYMETKQGETFMIIGVGLFSKPDDKPYTFRRLYPVVNTGKWKVKKQSDQVQFFHELNDTKHSYQYEKTIQLTKDKPELVLSHTLRNTGKSTIETSVYDHNFFVIDKTATGPDLVVKFPYNITGRGSGLGSLAEIKGDKIVFLRELTNSQGVREEVMLSGLAGFSDSAEDYDIRIENQKTGAGVRITCDQPLLRLNFWACPTTVCPEPYIKIKVDPGQEFQWKIKYEFYILSK